MKPPGSQETQPGISAMPSASTSLATETNVDGAHVDLPGVPDQVGDLFGRKRSLGGAKAAGRNRGDGLRIDRGPIRSPGANARALVEGRTRNGDGGARRRLGRLGHRRA